MTVEILRGDTAALPSCERAPELLPFSADVLTLACTDAESAYAVLRTASGLSAAYRVLRAVMDYGYAHDRPARVRLVCADEAAYRAYSFQWNMWFAERKPEHKE